jgi:hypothetical protein
MRAIGAGLGLLAATGAAAACTGSGGAQHSPEPTYRTSPIPAQEFDYEAYLEVLRRASGIENPPQTSLIRVIAPDELNTVWSDCMREAGFDVRITFDGGQGPPEDLPAEQAEAYKLADYVCYAQYPVDQSMYRPYGEEQYRILYDYYTGVLIPCLEREGWAVPPAPTYEVFRDSFDTDQWTPYDAVDVASLSMEQWEALARTCPQSPSDEVLFGE